ncbi:methanogenesis marker 14 protein [Methanothrix sp.]|uniref:methanogenesis marker 14 protein n=1 Tax=Methanothrix sp. TaxID=90426 RepID=UPI003297D114
MNLGRLFKPKFSPRIAESPPFNYLDLRSKPFYIVASVEVGNTTTKSILTATDLNTGKTYIVNKTVKMTRDVRLPKPGEEIFAHTINGTPLTKESVAELVKNTLIESHDRARLDIKTDLNFVVRSTGVVAELDSPEQVGIFIQALAQGCLDAGVPPRLMTPAMSIHNILEKFKRYTMIEKVIFMGAVASCFPPQGSTGVEVVANEMEGELATAGIKEGSRWTDVDFRNPCLSMDFGTTLDGRVTSEELPYAHTIGNLLGLAGAIPDAVVQGTGLVDRKIGATLDIFDAGLKPDYGKEAQAYADRIDELVIIEKVPLNRKKYGLVPVNPDAAAKNNVVLIGCDVGVNGSDLEKLSGIGADINSTKSRDLKVLFGALDLAMARVARRLVQVGVEEGIVTGKTAIGVTGRAGITGNKPRRILEEIDKLGLYDHTDQNVVFVDDGLARGAAVMARCMNSMGTPRNPLGGLRKGACILKKRMSYEVEKGLIPALQEARPDKDTHDYFEGGHKRE